jgi:hypothetical protein
MKLEELKDKIEEIEITYDYEDTYNNLYNTVIDYENDTQEWDFDYLFEEYVSYDLAEDIAKNELENGGLVRLYYFLGDANLNNDMFRINGYGNLEDINKEDLEYLKDEILNIINNKLEEE